MKGKQMDVTCQPSVPGPSVNLSFASPISDDAKFTIDYKGTPMKPLPPVNKSSIKQSIFVVERNRAPTLPDNELICDEELVEELISPNISQFPTSTKHDDLCHLPVFNQEMIRNESERFGPISDISLFEQKLRSDEKTECREYDEFIRCGFNYDDFGQRLDSRFELEVEYETFREDTPDDMDMDENCRPNDLPTFKFPKKSAFVSQEIPPELDVFDIRKVSIERNLIRESAVCVKNRLGNYKLKQASPTKGLLKPEPCFNDDGYFTFRRVSIGHTDQRSSMYSTSSINEKLSRLNINACKTTFVDNSSRFSKNNRTPESLSKMSPMLKRTYSKLIEKTNIMK
jgi:hypothetical protein